MYKTWTVTHLILEEVAMTTDTKVIMGDQEETYIDHMMATENQTTEIEMVAEVTRRTCDHHLADLVILEDLFVIILHLLRLCAADTDLAHHLCLHLRIDHHHLTESDPTIRHHRITHPTVRAAARHIVEDHPVLAQ